MSMKTIRSLMGKMVQENPLDEDVAGVSKPTIVH
jgi:hypothetical protein